MPERDLTAQALAAVQGTLIRPIVFFEGEYEGGTLRLHTGVGNLSWNGQTWIGAGRALEIAPVRESRMIEAIGFSIKLSGLDSSILATTLVSMRKNKPGKLWLGFYYPDDVLASAVAGYDLLSARWWTPSGGTPPDGYAKNESTAGESTWAIRTGPSGRDEVVHVSTNKDVTSDSEGGWDTGEAAFNIDKSLGYLFAVFAKKLTNNGNFYWGPNVFGTTKINDLVAGGGGSNTNPYFLNAVPTFPTTSAWYLAVGYIHPDGFGGADAGISGLYDMAGVKQSDGTEFRWASSATQSGHRCYAFNNATDPVDTECQNMTRPIVVACPTADATAMIQKIIRMATHDGLIADPYPLRRGRFDVAEIARGTDVAVIELKYEDRLVDLERARERRWTFEDQQLRLAGDKGFDQVPELQDAADSWGESFGPASPFAYTGPRGGRASR